MPSTTPPAAPASSMSLGSLPTIDEEGGPLPAPAPTPAPASIAATAAAAASIPAPPHAPSPTPTPPAFPTLAASPLPPPPNTLRLLRKLTGPKPPHVCFGRLDLRRTVQFSTFVCLFLSLVGAVDAARVLLYVRRSADGTVASSSRGAVVAASVAACTLAAHVVGTLVAAVGFTCAILPSTPPRAVVRGYLATAGAHAGALLVLAVGWPWWVAAIANDSADMPVPVRAVLRNPLARTARWIGLAMVVLAAGSWALYLKYYREVVAVAHRVEDDSELGGNAAARRVVTSTAGSEWTLLSDAPATKSVTPPVGK
ncbi:hypothetical protein H9P43_002186 [Blastocladiella emersonii ATCC 22665]|nr:hypothetical protein H9P43_002186 [Blastocladiella emersonii ATCC 22665]